MNITKVYDYKPDDLPLVQHTRTIPKFFNGVRPANLEQVEVPVTLDRGEKLYENRTIRDKFWGSVLFAGAVAAFYFLVLKESIYEANLYMTDKMSESGSTRIEYTNQYYVISAVTNNAWYGTLSIALVVIMGFMHRFVKHFPVRMTLSKDGSLVYVDSYNYLLNKLETKVHMREHMQVVPTYATGYNFKEGRVYQITDMVDASEYFLWKNDMYWNQKWKNTFDKDSRFYFDRQYNNNQTL